jgi:hypothetical protein
LEMVAILIGLYLVGSNATGAPSRASAKTIGQPMAKRSCFIAFRSRELTPPAPADAGGLMKIVAPGRQTPSRIRLIRQALESPTQQNPEDVSRQPTC